MLNSEVGANDSKATVSVVTMKVPNVPEMYWSLPANLELGQAQNIAKLFGPKDAVTVELMKPRPKQMRRLRVRGCSILVPILMYSHEMKCGRGVTIFSVPKWAIAKVEETRRNMDGIIALKHWHDSMIADIRKGALGYAWANPRLIPFKSDAEGDKHQTNERGPEALTI